MKRPAHLSKPALKRAVVPVAVASSALFLAGCAGVANASDWREDFRDAMEQEMPEAELRQACAGLTLLGIDTPEAMGAMILSFDEEGEIPDLDLTVAEWAEVEGESLDTLPFDVPDHVTVRDVLHEVGAYMLDTCGVDY